SRVLHWGSADAAEAERARMAPVVITVFHMGDPFLGQGFFRGCRAKRGWLSGRLMGRLSPGRLKIGLIFPKESINHD
ncbi:MAG: hypothetical protein QNI93_11850, partial [Kiloniellales bacterium]|nr:hypothetical protein [Kiloniellales bacterium]